MNGYHSTHPDKPSKPKKKSKPKLKSRIPTFGQGWSVPQFNGDGLPSIIKAVY